MARLSNQIFIQFTLSRIAKCSRLQFNAIKAKARGFLDVSNVSG
jgi:hypothetical protein